MNKDTPELPIPEPDPEAGTKGPLFFTPVGPDTPQAQLGDRLAALLSECGCPDVLALPTAIKILSGFQKVLVEQDPVAAVRYWDEREQRSDDWWLQHLPNSERAQNIREKRDLCLSLMRA